MKTKYWIITLAIFLCSNNIFAQNITPDTTYTTDPITGATIMLSSNGAKDRPISDRTNIYTNASILLSNDSTKDRITLDKSNGTFLHNWSTRETIFLPNNKNKEGLDTIYKYPLFKGNVHQFIQKELQYPKDARSKNIQGAVSVRYTINEQGNVINPFITRSIYPSLDSEALRIVRKMQFIPAAEKTFNEPSWTPCKIVSEESIEFKL